jgi:glutamate synthase (NADPH/NADH) small chain
VYEKSDRVGGLLMYGIPNMKLEKQIIDRKIEVMKAEGVTFITSANVGAGKAAMTPMVAKDDVMGEYLTNPEEKTVKADSILKEYDSVVLACGASNPRDIKAKGREAKGIYFAVDFLKTTTKSLLNSGFKDKKYVSAKGKNVLVIGGGDTGNDCVGTSIRQGCKGVVQLEMMPKPPVCRAESNPWPEWPKVLKTDYGQEEAIAVFGQDPRIYETTVKEFIKDKDGNVTKAKCVKLAWKKDEKTGRMNMSEIAGSEYEVPCDLVLIAAGFLGSQEYVSKAFGVALNERTNVKTEEGKHATNVPKVFATGDMRRGQSLVVWAIREGREAAREVDTALMGYSNL